MDRETVLNSSDFSKTNKKVKGAQVYKNDNNYYYRDTLHVGERAHLEVFNKRGIHIGEADPITGKIIEGTADAAKRLIIK